MEQKILSLYAITDRSFLKAGQRMTDLVEEALKGGATCVQYREKNLPYEQKKKEAEEILCLCRKYQVPCIINDDVDLALEIDADGVHVGQSDCDAKEARARLGKDKIIGVTAKTIDQAQNAQKAGADYLGSGAIFGSTTKKDAIPMTRSRLRQICKSVTIPVVAIGGIKAENIEILRNIPIAGVAVIGGIFGTENVKDAAAELRKCVERLKKPRIAVALTIAGSDSSGGAGIEADLKTMSAHSVYGMSAITALTAQNTVGVTEIMETEPEFLGKQLDCIFTDIYPDAVKIGMVSNAKQMQIIVEKLTKYGAENIVVDPVMVSSSGKRLMSEETVQFLESLFSIASLVTPNLSEAEVLWNHPVQTKEEIEQCASYLAEKFGCSVLLKGGHRKDCADDYLYEKEKGGIWLSSERIRTENSHGTGCTLSSAIASNLAHGMDLVTAVKEAKAYLKGALSEALDLGRGSGPLNHNYRKNEYLSLNEYDTIKKQNEN